MEVVEPGTTSRLVSEVTSKACGVFLWVVLVVERLILCLQKYKTISQLEEEIQALPSDLEKLYDHMLKSQDKQQQSLGSKYFQLVLRSMKIKVDIHLLQLSFAEEEDYNKSLSYSIQKMPMK